MVFLAQNKILNINNSVASQEEGEFCQEKSLSKSFCVFVNRNQTASKTVSLLTERIGQKWPLV